jgi:hypothetical protein
MRIDLVGYLLADVTGWSAAWAHTRGNDANSVIEKLRAAVFIKLLLI